MKTFEITLNRGLSQFEGILVLAPKRLYFLCEGKSNALVNILADGIIPGGLTGSLISAALLTIANLGADDSEEAAIEDLDKAVADSEHSFLADPADIAMVKKGWISSWFRVKGEKIVFLGGGMPKELRAPLKQWCEANHVANKGL